MEDQTPAAAPDHGVQPLAEYVARVAALVAPAQTIAANALLAARTGEAHEVRDLDDDLEITLNVADGLTRSAVLAVTDTDCPGCLSDEHALLDLIETSRTAVADAAGTVRDMLVRVYDCPTFTVHARLRIVAWPTCSSDDIDPYVRGRALGCDTPVDFPMSPQQATVLQAVCEDLASSLALPAVSDETEAHLAFTADGEVLATFELACDTARRAERWARWIITDAIAGCVTVPLDCVDIRVAAEA